MIYSKENLKSHLPKTYFGFPVDDSESSKEGESKSRLQKGIALLITILAVSMIMIFTANLIINSQVNLELSVKTRDNVKAEYMAKSGFNLALFLLGLDYGVNLFEIDSKKATELTDTASDFWALLNGLPIGGDTLEMISSMQESFNLSAVNDEQTINTLKLFDGQFVLQVDDEGNRINVNDCANGSCNQTIAMLEALMSCPAEKAFLEKKNLTASQLAYRIVDWVDRNTTAESQSGFSDENDAYQRKEPPYTAKNVPMDSLDELKEIEGWDDEVHKVFAPYLTVYPYGEKTSKINKNTVSKSLMGCFVPEALTECRDKFEQAFRQREEDGLDIKLSDFCYKSDTASDSSSNREKWFAGFSKVFRVAVSGQVGSQEKKLVAVVERYMPKQTDKYRRSYKILYWRLL